MNPNFILCDTEIRAYFLGLFMADGWCTKDGFHISLIDKELIDQLAKEIGFSGKICCYYNLGGYKSCQPTYRLNFTGVAARRAIISLGFKLSKKTGEEFLPVCLNAGNIRHFLRGFSDGDGCFTVVKNGKRHYLEWNVTCANKEFLENILVYLTNHSVISMKGHNIRERIGKHCFRLSLSHHDAIRLGQYFYENTTLYLKRKYTKWEEGKKILVKRKPKWTKIELENVLQKDITGRSKAAINIKRWQLLKHSQEYR